MLDEGILWFKSVDDFLRWVRYERQSGLDYKYNDNGIMVGWLRYPLRKQINVEVWQVMINGHKPGGLPGSNNDLVRVTQ